MHTRETCSLKKNYNTFSKIKRICYRNDMGGGGVLTTILTMGILDVAHCTAGQNLLLLIIKFLKK